MTSLSRPPAVGGDLESAAASTILAAANHAGGAPATGPVRGGGVQLDLEAVTERESGGDLDLDSSRIDFGGDASNTAAAFPFVQQRGCQRC